MIAQNKEYLFYFYTGFLCVLRFAPEHGRSYKRLIHRAIKSAAVLAKFHFVLNKNADCSWHRPNLWELCCLKWQMQVHFQKTITRMLHAQAIQLWLIQNVIGIQWLNRAFISTSPAFLWVWVGGWEHACVRELGWMHNVPRPIQLCFCRCKLFCLAFHPYESPCIANQMTWGSSWWFLNFVCGVGHY